MNLPVNMPSNKINDATMAGREKFLVANEELCYTRIIAL
jgi:hypothetical protein